MLEMYKLDSWIYKFDFSDIKEKFVNRPKLLVRFSDIQVRKPRYTSSIYQISQNFLVRFLDIQSNE